METDEIDTFSKPKPSKRKSLYCKVKGLTKFEIVVNHADRSSGRSEKEGMSCKNDTDDPSISADNEDKAQSDKSDHSDQQEREKLEARIEALKADSHELCMELKNLSEECNRFYDENQQIKDELIRTYGPSILHDLNELMQK